MRINYTTMRKFAEDLGCTYQTMLLWMTHWRFTKFIGVSTTEIKPRYTIKLTKEFYFEMEKYLRTKKNLKFWHNFKDKYSYLSEIHYKKHLVTK